jgi:hypothetical protein
LEDSKVPDLGGPNALGFRSLGSTTEVSYKLQSLGQMESLGFRREDSEFGHKVALGWSAEWISTLATKVWELANLSSFEVTTAKCLSEQLAKEKLALNDETRFQRLLCESSRAEVLQMKARIVWRYKSKVLLLPIQKFLRHKRSRCATLEKLTTWSCRSWNQTRCSV